MRILSLLMITLMLSGAVSAAEVLMATINNNEDSKYFKYYLNTNKQNEAVSFTKRMWKSKKYHDRRKRPNQTITYKVPRARAGTIVLEEKTQAFRTRKLIKMQTENFDSRTGADLDLQYVYYGWDLFNDSTHNIKHYKVEKIKLEKDDNGRWFLSQNGKEFKFMRFIMRTDKRLFFGAMPAGVKDCKVSMKPM